MSKSDRKTFAVRCRGEGGNGTAVLIVNASERLVGDVVMQYLRTKTEGYRQCAQSSLLQVEPHEDSEFADERVSPELLGVVLEYHYPEGEDHRIARLVYIDEAAKLADELDRLQGQTNGGRGVSCVQSVVAYLRRGDYSAARAVVNNESDKIRSYDAIVAVLERTGLWSRIDFASWGESAQD